MTTITVTIDDKPARDLFARLQAALSPAWMQDTMNTVAQFVKSRVDLCFNDETDPWGQPWAPLSATTLKRRRDGGRGGVSILRDTGQLAGAIAAEATGTEARIRIGFADRPATPHQFGNPENRFYNTPRGRPAPIPARAMLPIRPGGVVDVPPDWMEPMLAIMAGALDEAAKP